MAADALELRHLRAPVAVTEEVRAARAASTPSTRVTRRVAADGIRVRYDPGGLLRELVRVVTGNQSDVGD